MDTDPEQDNIKVLIADDDEHILNAYREAFSESDPTSQMRVLDELAAELFDSDNDDMEATHFDITACSQGDDAISLAQQAADVGKPFDVVILDVRMPPGIDGVEAGSQIRNLDPDVEIERFGQYKCRGVSIWRDARPNPATTANGASIPRPATGGCSRSMFEAVSAAPISVTTAKSTSIH